jgi:hypothetical protein
MVRALSLRVHQRSRPPSCVTAAYVAPLTALTLGALIGSRVVVSALRDERMPAVVPLQNPDRRIVVDAAFGGAREPRPRQGSPGRPSTPAYKAMLPTTGTAQRWEGHMTMTTEQQERAMKVLDAEYRLLASALAAAGSAMLVRTSIFLGVLSAAGVALGFVARDGIGRAEFIILALLVLPHVFFLGVVTFVRLVHGQRESVVCITGLNRIRHFFQDTAPETRPYFVLPAFDDEAAIYRSMGSGMNRRPPRAQTVFLIAQTPGVVGVVAAVVAATFAAIAATPLGPVGPWLSAPVAFVLTLVILLLFWQRSMSELVASIRSIYPTPAEQIEAPF